MRGRLLLVVALLVALPLGLWLLLRALPDAPAPAPLPAAALPAPAPPPVGAPSAVGAPSPARLEGPQAQPEGLPHFSVSGRVVDAGGAPVSGAKVTFEGRWRLEGPVEQLSGPDGSFRLEPVPQGSGHVTARLGEQVALAEVDVAGDVTGVELKLARGGQLVATVEDSQGHPLAGLEVSATHTAGGAPLGQTLTSDAKGQARFEALPEGEYNVTARRDAMSFGTSTQVKAGQTVNVTIRYLYDQEVSGVVTSGAGPVEGASVSLSEVSDAGWGIPARASTRTDLKGEFHLQVARGRYELLATADQGSKRMTVDAPASGLAVPLEGASTLKGTVVQPDGEPAPDYSVGLFLSDHSNLSEIPVERETTHADGTFAFEKVAHGRYRVEAFRADFTESRKAVQQVDANAPTVEVRLVLPAGVALEGTVVDEHHQPLEGASVSASALGQVARDRGTTGADGRFSLKNLTQSKVSLVASKSGYESKVMPEVAVPASGLELVLTRAGRVKGRVLLPNRSPAPVFAVNGRVFRSPSGEFELDLSHGSKQGFGLDVPQVGSSVWVVETSPGETQNLGDLVAVGGPPLLVQVVDPQGKPASGTTVSYAVMSGHDVTTISTPHPLTGHSFGLPFQLTDAKGEVTLDAVASPGIIVFAHGPAGLANVPVSPGQSSVTVRLESLR